MKLPLFTRSLFARLLLYITLALSVVVALTAYALYYSFMRVTLESVSTTNANYLVQTSYGANYMNDHARNFTLSIFNNTDTSGLMYNAQDSGTSELYLEVDRMQAAVEANSFVHSVYVYNKKLHRFISTFNSPFMDEEEFFDQEAVAMMRNPQRGQRLKPLVRKIASNTEFPKEINVLTYVIYDNFSEKEGVDGAVIVNIYIDYLQNLITSFNTSTPMMSGDTFIVDGNDHFILNSKSEEIPDLSPVLAKVTKQTKKIGYESVKWNGEKMLVTYAYSDVMNWWFIHLQPKRDIMQNTERVRNTTLLISFSLLILGLILSLIISKRLYSPFGQLVGRVGGLVKSSAGSDIRRRNEVELLNEVVSEAYAWKRNSMQFRRNERLKSILADSALSNEELRVLFKNNDIDLNVDVGYVLISYRIDRYTAFVNEFTEKDRELLKFAICNAADEAVGGDYRNEVVDMGGNLLIHIVNVDEMNLEKLEERLSESVSKVQLWCQANLRFSVSATIGGRNTDFSELHDRYKETVTMSEYRFIAGHDCLLFVERLKLRESAASEETSTAEQQLLYEALVDGKLDKARAIYAQIMNKVINRSYDTIMSNILYLLYFVHNTMRVMERNSVDRYSHDFHSYLQQVSQAETIEEVNGMFDRIFEKISEVVNERKDSRSARLVDSVMKFIETNYTDTGLCLDTVAVEMNLSKMYVGKLFREASGQSVADYILDVRMRRAIELLLDDSKNKTLVDILDEVGVENKKYFYILFKKKMGVSFSDYRHKFKNLVKGD